MQKGSSLVPIIHTEIRLHSMVISAFIENYKFVPLSCLVRLRFALCLAIQIKCLMKAKLYDVEPIFITKMKKKHRNT